MTVPASRVSMPRFGAFTLPNLGSRPPVVTLALAVAAAVDAVVVVAVSGWLNVEVTRQSVAVNHTVL